MASGKGGTGKTTVAVGLALALADSRPVQLLDADVEAPNAHLFLDVRWREERPVVTWRPRIDPGACDLCGLCVEACEFGALARAGERILVFDELCHGCGLCRRVCPREAITEIEVPLGRVEVGEADGFAFARGVLDVGEATATPVVHALKREIRGDRLAILDCPPGTGCPTIASLRGCDAAVLVTEPTPFGLHDLRAAVSVARAVGVPAGVVINRDGIGDDGVLRWCEEEGVPVLARIPFDREIAASCAEGRHPGRESGPFRETMETILAGLEQEVLP